MKKILILLALFFSINNLTLIAGEADVVDVRVEKSGNSYRFDVTVLHEDAGWKHYANKWDIVAEDGTVLGTRVLYHPHDDEQPFTRSLSGVLIPEEVKAVTIRAHDLKHGYGGKTLTVDLR